MKLNICLALSLMINLELLCALIFCLLLLLKLPSVTGPSIIYPGQAKIMVAEPPAVPAHDGK